MEKPKVIFRADGNSKIGLGHLIRALSMLAILKNDYDCVFAIQQPSETIKDIISTECKNIIELPFTENLSDEARFLSTLNPDAFVIDGYHFDLQYQEILKSQKTKLAFIDDIYNKPFVADIVINPAGGIDEEKYKLAPYTKLYTGPNFAILREAFYKACLYAKEVNQNPGKFLVCLGGADPENKTIEIVAKLKTIESVKEINIVLGAAYNNTAELEKLADEKKQINIYKNLDASVLCSLMQSCDAAVCPPSTISYEWCCNTGLLFLLQTADNQKNIKNFLVSNQLAFNYNQITEVVESSGIIEIQKEQIFNQRKYFDGSAKYRLQRIFNELILAELLFFRKADASDVKLLFDWVNDDEVRKASFSTEKIAFEKHSEWFQQKINDPKSLICIANIKEQPAGMIRFDVKPNETVISYLLDENYRGKSLGSTMLEKGIAFFKSNYEGTYPPIIGYIKNSNFASIKAFLKAGFEKINEESPAFADSGKYLYKDFS